MKLNASYVISFLISRAISYDDKIRVKFHVYLHAVIYFMWNSYEM